MAHPDPAARRSTSPRPIVAHSWSRSAGDGVRRDRKALPEVRITDDALTEYRQSHALGASLGICRELLADTARDAGCVFAVSDAEGLLLLVEGDPVMRRRAEQIHFAEGATWSEAIAGTNAPGTALALGTPVWIAGGEHYNEAVQPWSCVAAPIRDPDSGTVLGSIDLTGGDGTATPHAFALVRAVARAVEADMARRTAVTDQQATTACSRLMSRLKGPAALVNPSGRVIGASGDLGQGLDRQTIAALGPAGALRLNREGFALMPDGRRLAIEQVGPNGYLVIRFVEEGDGGPQHAPVRLSALGRDTAILDIDGRRVQLSPRHSEIVLVLAFAAEGMSAGRMAVELSVETMRNVTIRADISRLRHVLGDELLASQPYALLRTVRTDVHALLDLLAEGRVRDALTLYPGPLLPNSQAPAVIERRASVEQQLRGAVLAGRDPALLHRWVNQPWGADDLLAWQTLERLLPLGSAQRGAAALRAWALGGVLDAATPW